MEQSQSGLFAFHVASLHPEAPMTEPEGSYDPTEQLWRDHGNVTACDQNCMDECHRYSSYDYCLLYCGCYNG